MLVRVRKEDGTVVRFTVEPQTTVGELKREILRLGHSNRVDLELLKNPSLTDSRLQDETASLEACGVTHGDLLVIERDLQKPPNGESVSAPPSGARSPAPNATAQGGCQNSTEPTATPQYLVSYAPSGLFTESEYERACEAYSRLMDERRKRKQHEFMERRGLGGLKGMTVDYLEWLDAQHFRLRSQDESPCSQCSIDRQAADAFQSYLLRIHDSQMRYGILYGDVVASEGLVKVEAIFEPPQAGDADRYLPLPESEVAIREADTLAHYLGMRRVGWIFTHRAEDRSHALHARDVAYAAKLQLETTAYHLAEQERDQTPEASFDWSRYFVTIAVSIQPDGRRHFEAYQLSDQCLLMAQAGILMPVSDSGELHTLDEVVVEGNRVRRVDTDFFLVLVPIRDHQGWLRTAFPIENREVEPQSITDVQRVLESGYGKFTERIADFHLLLFLSRILGMESDMPLLANAIVERRDLEPAELGYQLLIESLR